MEPRPLSAITVKDCMAHRIWSYVPSRDGQIWLRPLAINRASSFKNRMVSCQVTLASGEQVWTLIEFLKVELPKLSEHWRRFYFLLPNGKWFQLARYHERLQGIAGPKVLAKALKLKPSQVFPFRFDVSEVCTVQSTALADVIAAQPRERLTLEQIMPLVRQIARLRVRAARRSVHKARRKK